MKLSPSLAKLILWLTLGALTLVLASETAARSEISAPLALVRVEVRTPAERQQVAALAQPWAQLWDTAGQEYLLATADAHQQAALAAEGLALRILDADTRTASYYLLRARQPQAFEDALKSARQSVTLLDVDGLQAVARAQPAEAERLSMVGIQIARLGPDPIVLKPHLASVALPHSITPDPLIQTFINQVSAATVWDYTGNLSGENPVSIGGSPYTILTRYSRTTTPIEKATQYVYEHLQALGLSTSYHTYNLSGSGTRRNVVAEQPGLGQPSRIFLITAHLDDTSSQNGDPYTYAPGADDNASGSVAVLIAADILSQYDFDCTLRYVLFTGEEQGLIGSAAYATYVYNLGEDIEGVLNLDMIAYNSDSAPILDLHARSAIPASVTLANLFVDVVNAYNLNLTPEIFINDSLGNYSDNKSFWDKGYAAILAIEDDDDFTPYYHKTTDTRATLNQAYFTEFVKAAVGTLAHMGCLLPPQGYLAGQVTDADSGTPLGGATVRAALDGGQAWSTLSQTDGRYRLELAPGTYTVSAVAPGHMITTSHDVPIQANITTTLNLALPVTPTLTVTGYVRAADTAAPLAATITALGSPFPPAYSDPASGYYTLQLFPGDYVLQAQAEHYLPMTHTIQLTDDLHLDFDLTPPCLLVLDDDDGASYQTYYTTALDRLGYTYEIASALPAGFESLPYQAVIWLSGDASANTLTPADQAALAAYLDAGGRLFLSGQNIGQDIGNTDFYQQRLHASLLTANSGLTSLSGLNFLGPPLVDIFIQGSGGANNQTSPDGVTPLQEGYAVYRYTPNGPFGGVAYDGFYRSVYFAFGYEAINRQIDRDNVMQATLNHLGVCSPTQPPQAAFTYTLAGLTAAFTNTSQGLPWLTYSWDFGDGSALSHAVHPTHTFAAPGVYTATLTTTNRYGSDNFAAALQVTLPCTPLSGVDFDYAPLAPFEGQVVTFTAVISGGAPPFTLTWDFGDGSQPLSGTNLSVVTHTFSISDTQTTFTTTLTAANSCSSASRQKPIQVNSLPDYMLYLPLVGKTSSP